MKKNLTLLFIFVFGAFVLYQAYQKGEAKNLYTYEALPKVMPIPVLFDSVEGTAQIIEGQKIRVTWNKTNLPSNTEPAFFQCLGYIRPMNTTYYLMLLDGTYYVENGEFVEPLIYAMYRLHLEGKQLRTQASTLDSMIRLLPDDPKALRELAGKLKKVDIDEGPPEGFTLWAR